MFKFCFPLIALAVITALGFAASLPVCQDPAKTPVQEAAKPEPVAKTVQIFLDTDADVMIQSSDGKRTGLDFKSRQFVNEIPDARVIARESSTSYVLPYDKSGRPYTVMITGKSMTRVDANLSLTGPGFVVGFRGVPLLSGQVQTMNMAANGLHLSFTANQDGPTPQLFFTSQSGRGKPSYRFEVSSSSLTTGKTITVDLDSEKGRLLFKSDDAKKDSFNINIRRTNPGGLRNMYTHQDISFSSANSYAMDFGAWDGKGEMCCYEVCASCKDNCMKQKNESSVP